MTAAAIGWDIGGAHLKAARAENGIERVCAELLTGEALTWQRGSAFVVQQRLRGESVPIREQHPYLGRDGRFPPVEIVEPCTSLSLRQVEGLVEVSADLTPALLLGVGGHTGGRT